MVRESDNGFGEWGGYMEAKISKLEEQFAKASDPFRQSNLFTGISIYVNGLTNPSADELKRIMMVNGGTYHHYQRSHTTYIVASNLPDVKIRNMNTGNIISPQWIVDCLKAKRLLHIKNYLLYTNHKPSQPKLTFNKKEEAPPNSEAGGRVDKDKECLYIMQELEELNKKMNKNDPNQQIPSPEVSDEAEQKLEIPDRNNETRKPLPGPTKYAKSAIDPNFLSEFYNNSRLHHIATLGAGFKQYVSELREKHSGAFPDRDKIRHKLPKSETLKLHSQTIMHIDMDCFFVSVGLRSRPHLRGQPIAVTHSKGGEATVRPGVDRQREMELYMKRIDEQNMPSEKIKNGFEGTDSLSEIASCSYEARKMGVRNGMFMGQALKLCPQLKTIPYDFDEYKEVAFTLYNTVAQYSLNIEAVSCDEMFVDLTDVLNDLQADTMKFVECLRDEVKSKTGCPCSAGVGENRLQARMATKKAKPDGQFFLSPDNVESYMANISINDLPGVGYSTSRTLEQIALKTCGDLQKISLTKLQSEIGKKFGETLFEFCRGIDSRPLVYGQIRKSVSAEVNYGIRFTESEELEKFLRQLCTEVHSRLMEIKRRGKCITLKLMIRSKDAPVESSKFMGHGYCDNLSKSTSLSTFTCDLNVITKTILTITKSLNIPPKELRGIGIQISKLDNPAACISREESVLKAMFSKAAEKRKEDSAATTHATLPQQIKLTTPTKLFPEKRKSSPSSAEKKRNNKVMKKGRGKVNQPAATLKTRTVHNMLQTAAQKPLKNDFLADIDLTVLAELPEDIREEILREHKKFVAIKPAQAEIAVAPKTSVPEERNKAEVDPDFLKALPPKLCNEIQNDMQKGKIIAETVEPKDKFSKESNEATNIYGQKDCRKLLESWVESSDVPEDYDIDMVARNAQEFIQLKRIHDLHVPLRLLYRIINEKRCCAWHAAYKNILQVVQSEMVAVYGSRMSLNERFDCENCGE